MKKKLARITGCLLCFAMLLSMAAPALAVRARDPIAVDAPALEEDGGSVVDVSQYFTEVPVADLSAEDVASKVYEIYPTPQAISYQTTTVTLPETMQVTYGEGIDQYTKARAEKAFGEVDVQLSESAITDVKLTVSIDKAATGNADKNDAYKLTIDSTGITVVGVHTDAAFYGLTTVMRILQQTDETTREVRCLTVQDYADVAFRGFIEGYYGNPWTVDDRAALMEFGGGIKMNIYFYAPKDDPKHSIRWYEKYTGEELDRLIKPLAKAGNESKCYYGFALHPFWNMGDGNDPFDFSSDAAYNADLTRLKAKFEQAIEAGVRQIAILADDIGMPTPDTRQYETISSNDSAEEQARKRAYNKELDKANVEKSYVRLMKDLTAWVSSDEMQNKYEGLKTTIPFCPNDYMSNASSGQMQALKELMPADVPLIQTGGDIWGSVSSSYLNTYRGNMGDRGVFMWINWPCSDKSQASLIMGAHDTVLQNNLTAQNVSDLKGIMLNPMQQSEPSKAAIFCNADYAWNIWNDSATSAQRIADVWRDCFKYVDHDSPIENEYSTALRELSKHMIHNNGVGAASWRFDWHDSTELNDEFNAFREAMQGDALTAEQIDDMKAHFQTLHDSAALYKSKTTGNVRILGFRKGEGEDTSLTAYPTAQEQMGPWLEFWVEYTNATLKLLDALKEVATDGDGSRITTLYLEALSELDAANSHSFLYMEHYENALAGGEYLVPFTNDLKAQVGEEVKALLDPTILIERVVSSRTDVSDLSPLRDGSDSTSITFKSPTTLSVGDYIGVVYNRPIDLTSVNFKLGDTNADNGKNTFGACKLQYTEDGKTWTDIPGTPTIVNNTKQSSWSGTCRVAEIGIDGLSLSAKGVRVAATEALSDVWIVAREIYINGQSGADNDDPTSNMGQKLSGTVIKSELWSAAGSTNESSLTDGDDSTFVWYDPDGAAGSDVNGNKSLVGDYLGLDLGSAQPVGLVRFVVGGGDSDKWTNFKLQYSTDNTNWTDAGTFASNNGRDVIEQDLGGVSARYVRFVNTQEVTKWLKFSEFSVFAPNDSFAVLAYQSETVKTLVNPTGEIGDASSSIAVDSVTLRGGEFIGIDLGQPRILTEVVCDISPAAVDGLVFKVGPNEAELVEVGPDGYEGLAQYLRLENTGVSNVSFRLNEMSVQWKDLLTGTTFYESNMRKLDGQDARTNNHTHRWFDGDISTSAKFCDQQKVGNYVTYQFPKTQEIRNIKAYVLDSQTDYVRRGKIQVSMDNENWVDVVNLTGNDLVSNASTTAQAAGWAASSRYPNYVYKEGSPEGGSVQANFIRVLFTDSNFTEKWLVFNEIVINDGEYVSGFTNPAYEVDPTEGSVDYTPDKALDGDLATGFRPNMTGRASGSFVYHLSGDTSIGQINVIQDSGNISNAVVAVRTGEDESGNPVWVEVGTLDASLSQIDIPENIANVLSIRFTWGDVNPTFNEIMFVHRDAVAESGGQTSSSPEDTPINSYSGSDCTINFDENWKFNLGDADGAQNAVFNDSAWRLVNLPHDYSIEGSFTSAGEAESGYLIGGVGWYRKSFTVDPSWEGKTVTIDFGGVYMDCDVYLNGEKLGEHHYGYSPFSFVLSNLNYTGENTIAVKTDDAFPSSRWYSGAGIYRSVHLTVSEPVHVARYGTYVNPVKGSGDNWTVTVETSVQNDSNQNASGLTVEHELYKLGSDFKPTGSAVATVPAQSLTVNGSSTETVSKDFTVTDPDLWYSWDKCAEGTTPALYVLKTTIKQNGTVVDTHETEFGFRSIEFSVNDGFKLNGQNVKLKGVCQHHDQGALGAEAWYRALERQVDILMEMGCNSIRVTHNPAADELIEICNRKGILLIDEIFDGWHRDKNGNSGDFARWFSQTIGSDNALVGKKADETWAQFVLETVVNRDRNAPSVIMYSLGNEIVEGTGGYNSDFDTNADNLIARARALDTTRSLTYGQNGQLGTSENKPPNVSVVADKLHAVDGVIGINYHAWISPAEAHSKGWRVYASETASAVNSRGVYNVKDSCQYNGDILLTSYDKSTVSWGETAALAWWNVIRFDYVAGDYPWTGFDYIGEPTPSNGTGPGWRNTVNGELSPKNSYFGIVDTAGLPKDSYYLYRSQWNEKDTTLHVLPTWDRDDLMIDSSGKVEVVVYSNAPTVKVFLNGNEVGSANSVAHKSNTGTGLYTYRTFDSGTAGVFVPKSNEESLYATFNVPYDEGTLEVKAYDANGAEITETVGRDVVRTTTGAAKLVTTADRPTIKNDGRDLSYITIDIVDENGEIVNGATNEVTVTVEGDGKFMGLDNGVQPDHTSYLSPTRKAGAGRLVAIVQSTKAEGSFTLTATAKGLASSSVEVFTSGTEQSSEEATPVSFTIPKTYYVQINTEPTLAETADVTMSDGTKRTGLTITWNEWDKDQLAVSGNEFAITGTIDKNGLNIPVSVGVVVLDKVAALLNWSTAVQVGQTPTLPASRPAVMADGTVVSAQFEVKWDAPGDEAYAQVGSVTVEGTADVFGKTLPVKAFVRVGRSTVTPQGNYTPSAFRLFLDEEEVTDAGTLEPLRDGNAATTWTGSGALQFVYATSFGLTQVNLVYQNAAATSGVTISTSGDGNTWTEQTPRVTTSGSTATYTLPALTDAVYVKVELANEVTLSELELIRGSSSFPIGSTAVLDGLRLDGEDTTPVKQGSTPDAPYYVETSASNPSVVPVSDDNVAVTVLPENADSQIILVTESEDHASRQRYVIQLDCVISGADDDSKDYPYAKTTPSAESQAGPGDNGEGGVSHVTDNDTGTFWHTRWGSGGSGTTNPTDLTKRYVQLTLDDPTKLIALRYLPRSGAGNGTVTKYRVAVSTDDNTYTPVSEGEWSRTDGWKLATFDAPVVAKYVRLYGVETYRDSNGAANAFMTCAELRVVVAPETKLDLSAAEIEITDSRMQEGKVFFWTNAQLRPEVTVSLYGEELTEGTDYTLTYQDNVDPGTAYIYAHAMDGSDYQGAASTTFSIVKVDSKVQSFHQDEVTVYPGIHPENLPTVVLATYENGTTAELPVTWGAIDPSWYNHPTEPVRILNGELSDPDISCVDGVHPTLKLKFPFSDSVTPVNKVTVQNVVPSLPTSVTVTFTDGVSAERQVEKWYLKGGDADTALTAADFATAGDTVEVEGVIVGIDRVKAIANIRVVESAGEVENLSQSSTPDTNANRFANTSIFPFPMAWFSAGNNNPYVLIDGTVDENWHATWNDSKAPDRWSEYESGEYHDTIWVGVAFEAADEITERKQNQTVTLKDKVVSQAVVRFADENQKTADPLGAVTYPASYDIQYYTGPTENLVFDTRLSYLKLEDADNNRSSLTLTTGGNGRVRDWSNSPLNDDSNWTTVDYIGDKPAIVLNSETDLTVNFAPVSTSILRVKMTKRDSHWVGMTKLEVLGQDLPTGNSDFEVLTATLTYEGQAPVDILDDFKADGDNFVTSVTLAANDDVTAGIPKLALTASNNAVVSIKPATRVDGTGDMPNAIATITSEDGSKVVTYTVRFSRQGSAGGHFVDSSQLTEPHKSRIVITPKDGAPTNATVTLSVKSGYEFSTTPRVNDGLGNSLTLTKVGDTYTFPMPATGAVILGVTQTRAKTYTITYELDGGTLPSGANPTTYNIESRDFTLTNPTRSGYTFLGWIGSNGNVDQTTVKITCAEGGDRFYQARWKSNTPAGDDKPTNPGSSSSSGGGGSSAPVDNVTTTTKDPATGATTVTTITPQGMVTSVTTNPDGSQTASVLIPGSSSSEVSAILPDLKADASPELVVKNNASRPVTLTVPVSGSGTIVAVRVEEDGSETVIPLSVMDEEGLRFQTRPGAQTIRIVDNKKDFVDVPDSHWAAKAVDFVASRELFNGMGRTDTFAPGEVMTRAMMTTVMWRLAEKPNAVPTELFDDVKKDSYYEKAVAWGVANGVVKGTDVGFEPETPISREMLAVLVYRSAGSPAVVDEMPRRFADGDQVAGWARDAVVWCIANDILRGRDGGMIDPQATATRAEVATLLQRFVDRQV